MPRRLLTGLRAAFALCLGLAVLGANAVNAEDPLSEASLERMTSIEDGFKQSISLWRTEQKEAMDKAIKAGGPIPAMAMMPPAELFMVAIKDCEGAAATYAGKSDAIPFLLWITRNGPSAGATKEVKAAVETLGAAHLGSEHMSAAPEALASAAAILGDDLASSLLRQLALENPNPDVQAGAYFVLLRQTLAESKLGSPAYKTARETLLTAKARCKDGELAARIQAAVDAREGLTDGSIAPDISGVDMDGVSFKLSDYKGKIIMLDFWGDW